MVQTFKKQLFLSLTQFFIELKNIVKITMPEKYVINLMITGEVYQKLCHRTRFPKRSQICRYSNYFRIMFKYGTVVYNMLFQHRFQHDLKML